MKSKVKIIKKILKSPCMCVCPDNKKPNPKCTTCHGSGIYRDFHYFMIINNKICYDMDTLK
jgi:hypothetical protein